MHIISKTLSGLRYAAYIAVFSSAAGTLLMFFIGAKKIYKAFLNTFIDTHMAVPKLSPELMALVPKDDISIALVIESLDAFLIALILIALILIMFSYGVYVMFITGPATEKDLKVPGTLIPKDIKSLKENLAQTVVIVLIVLFARVLWINLQTLSWEILIMPASILMLALSIKLLDLKQKGWRADQ